MGQKNKKYLTIVFSYLEDSETEQGNVAAFLNTVLKTVREYNIPNSQGATKYDHHKYNSSYPSFDLFGVYVDEDDMSIDEQNKFNSENIEKK